MNPAVQTELFAPLRRFCEAAGRSLPESQPLDSDELPLQAKLLLAHSGDMTSKLEEFHSSPQRLRVLFREHQDGRYRREVLLYNETNGKITEYGAIEIHIGNLPPQLQSEILGEQLPLGGILNRHHVGYRSNPRGFFALTPDTRLQELFGMTQSQPLFGRSNVLLAADDSIIAEIVEILPPLP